MQAQLHPHSVESRYGLAEIPESWNSAYKHRRHRAWVARIVLWGAVVVLALFILLAAGRMIG